MIILLSSKLPQTGKDVVGNYLVENHNFKRLGFADRVKEIALEFGWDGKKDDKGRELLINIGTISGRTYNKDIWVNYVAEKIKFYKKEGVYSDFVICDNRFLSEVKRMKNIFGNEIKSVGIESETYGDKKYMNDISQIEYMDIPKDYVIKNNGTLKELYEEIEDYYNYLRRLV